MRKKTPKKNLEGGMPKGLPGPTVPLSPGTYVHGPEDGIEYWADMLWGASEAINLAQAYLESAEDFYEKFSDWWLGTDAKIPSVRKLYAQRSQILKRLNGIRNLAAKGYMFELPRAAKAAGIGKKKNPKKPRAAHARKTSPRRNPVGRGLRELSKI
jgi:hypothetical protein